MSSVADYLRSLYAELQKYVPEVVYAYLPQSILRRTLLVGATAGFLAYVALKKRYKLPPGPFALPLVGNLLFLTGSKETLGRTFLRLSKKYGPVFTLYQGPFPVVVLNNMQVINEALLTRSAHFSDRWTRYSTKQMTFDGCDIVFGNYTEEWKLRRKIIAKAIRSYLVTGNLNIEIERAVSKTVDAMLTEEGSYDPSSYMIYTTINILFGICFRTSYEYNDDNYLFSKKLLEDLLNTFADGILLEDFIPPLRLFPSKKFLLTQELARNTHGFLNKRIEEHVLTLDKDNISDITHSLLQAQKNLEAENPENAMFFQQKHILAALSNLILAGMDTTSQTLNWALLYISAYPNVQLKIFQEVDRVVGRERYPTTADRDNLPYTDAVVHEVLRLGTSVPVGVPHLTACDTKLGEYDIPKDTTVFINHWGLHYDPDNWTDVEKFIPERFLDQDGKMAPRPENWLPFSAGRRVCIGETIAKPELHLIIASLIQRLYISPDPSEPINVTADESQLSFSPHPYKIIIKNRRDM